MNELKPFNINWDEPIDSNSLPEASLMPKEGAEKPLLSNEEKARLLALYDENGFPVSGKRNGFNGNPVSSNGNPIKKAENKKLNLCFPKTGKPMPVNFADKTKPTKNIKNIKKVKWKIKAGYRYGSLTLGQDVEEGFPILGLVKVKCDCGAAKPIRVWDLVGHKTKTCGRRECRFRKAGRPRSSVFEIGYENGGFKISDSFSIEVKKNRLVKVSNFVPDESYVYEWRESKIKKSLMVKEEIVLIRCLKCGGERTKRKSCLPRSWPKICSFCVKESS